MDTTYSITFTLKTTEGLECFGKFLIGKDRECANDIFQQLKGEIHIEERYVLFVDLIETLEGLPTNLNMIGCTLEELAENCKIITRELFKLKNIKEQC